MIENNDALVQPENDAAVKKIWEPPSLTSFKPVSETQGFSVRIGDGFNNLS